MIFELEQVNRLFSLDALTFIPILMIIYHIFLIKNKEWKAIAVFHIAGVLNFLLEIIMCLNGSRFVASTNIFFIFLALFTLSWIDIGFFTSLAYLNTNYLFKNSEINRADLLVMNALFFIGLPVVSLDWGIFNQKVLTGRYVTNPEVQLSLQLACVILIAGILYFTGYRHLLAILLLNGVTLGICFQTRLYLSGIRQASVMSLETLMIDTFTLATMPIMGGALLFILFQKVDFLTFGDKPPLPRFVMNLRITLAGLKVLIKEIGLFATLAVAKDLISQKKEGHPWKDLPEARDQKDIDSRNLIGDAILIYNTLKNRMEQEKALKITKRMIREAAIMQLYSLIPILKKKEIEAIPQEKQQVVLTEIIDRFPNADWKILEVTENSFTYRITRCRLVELVNEIGYPELSDAFCPGDLIYFEKFQPDIVLTRPDTIGYAKEYCDFIFELKA